MLLIWNCCWFCVFYCQGGGLRGEGARWGGSGPHFECVYVWDDPVVCWKAPEFQRLCNIFGQCCVSVRGAGHCSKTIKPEKCSQVPCEPGGERVVCASTSSTVVKICFWLHKRYSRMMGFPVISYSVFFPTSGDCIWNNKSCAVVSLQRELD